MCWLASQNLDLIFRHSLEFDRGNLNFIICGNVYRRAAAGWYARYASRRQTPQPLLSISLTNTLVSKSGSYP